MIKGKATSEHTHNCQKTFLSLTYNKLGNTNLMVSQAGVGTYRMGQYDIAHQESLSFALEMGINLIDTSANYMNGDAEQLIGKTLQKSIDENKLNRESVVIVSKGGYVQGRNWEAAQEREQNGKPYPELVGVSEGLAHCIHPEFLEDQITLSLERLNVECIDIYLLHNPEYFLEGAMKNYDALEARRQYYRRIEAAFRFLEKEVEKGRIQYYGISSNTFPVNKDNPLFTSLDRVLECAHNVSDNHHFNVIQMPFNLFENGAAVEPNQAHDNTVLELAKKHRLGVLINRPLNAIVDHQIRRLAQYEQEDQEADPVIEDLIQALEEMEIDFETNLFPKINLEKEEEKYMLTDVFSIGKQLNQHWKSFQSFVHFKDILLQLFIPNIELGLSLITQVKDDGELETWINHYLQRVNVLSKQISNFYKLKDAVVNDKIIEDLSQLSNSWKEASNLSGIAIRALRSTEGVSCVLVGMRDIRYVEDILSELSKKIDFKNYKHDWKALELKSV